MPSSKTTVSAMPLALDRELLKERAYRELKELIQSGELPPHEALSERQLAERLGMSKTPIRAALGVLEVQGLVFVSSQRGIFVRELTAREINELFETRIAIEPFVVRQLAKRRWTPEQRAALNENLLRQRAAAKQEDALSSTKLDIEFHLLLLGVLDNREMIAWSECCFDKLHRSVLHINQAVPGRLLKSWKDHAAIAAAILKGNPAQAVSRVIEHLNYGRQFLLGLG